MFIQGAPESLVDRCTHVRVGSNKMAMTPNIKQEILKNIKFYGTGICQGAAGVRRRVDVISITVFTQ